MPSIQNSEKPEQITIRCSSALKKAVRIAAAERDSTIEDLCADLLSVALGLAAVRPAPKRRTA